MSLDMGEIVLQLDELARSARQTALGKDARLISLLERAQAVDPGTAQERTTLSRERPYLAAQTTGPLVGAYPPPDPPGDWSVAAVDGSHIDADRHLPVQCYLINLGSCVLTYGQAPDAQLSSRPHLAAPEELRIVDPHNPSAEETVTGPLLGLVRTVGELEELGALMAAQPPRMPVLGLVDGSLVLWGLSGQGYRPYVRDAIIRDRLLPALDRAERLAADQPTALAAYISYPRSTEVVNAVRCCLCPHSLSACSDSCNNRRSVQHPCAEANDFLDRDLFQTLLQPGWRSPVYRTNSSVPRDYYGPRHQVCFFYLNAGEEIGRVEVPEWVAQDETLLALAHGLVWDQCRRGQGYPVAISESHEQAVVNGADRRVFRRLLTDALERQGVLAATSGKDRSKRAPWL